MSRRFAFSNLQYFFVCSFLILLNIAILPSLLIAESHKHSKSTAGSIKHGEFSISIGSTNQSGRCSIEVRFGGVAPAKVEHFSLSDPARIVVDFEGIKIKSQKRFPVTSNSSCVSSVRFGVHPTSTRIVFDLADERGLTYEIAQVGNALVFNPELGKHSALTSAAESKITKPTATVTPLPTFTPTASPTPTVEIIPTAVPPTAKPIITVVIEPTVTPTPTETPEPTFTPTATATPQEPDEEELKEDDSGEAEENTEKPDEVDFSGTTKDVTSSVIDTPEGRVFRHEVRPDLKFQVDQVLVELDPTNPSVKNLVVTNVGEHTLHMTARAVALNKPGTEDEEEMKTDKLLVSPLLFDLQPKEQRRVRLVGLSSPPDVEQTFRVHLVPLQDDFDTTINMKLHGVEARLNIITALAVTVLRLPENPRPQLKETRIPGKVILENVGNQHVSLSEIKICGQSSSTGCRELADRRIFPGNSWQVDLPHSARLQMLQKLGSEFQPLRIEGMN